MEAFKDMLLTLLDQYDFMICHERNKFKEVNKSIKQLIKVNEITENKVDLEPYMTERNNHANQLAKYKIEQRKLNRIYKILFND
jgi:hypothetical protein